MKTGMVVRVLALLMLVAGAAACDDGNNSPTQPPVFVGPAELQIIDVRVGTGATLAAGQVMTANYALWLYDPAATDFKGTPLQAGQVTARALNTNNLIPGWVQGLPGMKVGGIRRLIIPPSLAYGSTGQGTIPPNAWLVFEVELLSIQ